METHTNTAAIEISDTSVKFAVGYCLNKRPVIVYYDSRPLKEGAVIDGRIVNAKEVSKVVSEFLHISDDSIRAKVNGMCSVLIPSIGYKLILGNYNQICSYQDSKIGPLDVQNLINQAQNNGVSEDLQIVDIIPTKFALDDGRVSKLPPYGEISNHLRAELAIHVVGRGIYNEQKTTVEESGFRVDQLAVSAYSAGYLINNQGTPQSGPFFYVDLGARTTDVALIDTNCQLWHASSFSKRGGDDLTTAIASRFMIDKNEAEKMKLRHGYNPIIRKYELPLFEGTNFNGEKIRIMQSDLNAIIEEFFASLFVNIETCMDVALKTSSNVSQQFPLIVGGGASKLIGIEKLLEKFAPKVKSIKLFTPEVMGARDPGLIPLLGLIALNGKESRQTDPSFRGMSTLTRQ